MNFASSFYISADINLKTKLPTTYNVFQTNLYTFNADLTATSFCYVVSYPQDDHLGYVCPVQILMRYVTRSLDFYETGCPAEGEIGDNVGLVAGDAEDEIWCTSTASAHNVIANRH